VIKTGVELRGLQPQMAIAYTIACWVYWEHASVFECVITSALDSKHMTNSLHAKGLALDLRTHTLLPSKVLDIHHELQLRLGEQFDCVMEEDHIHLEYQPKTPVVTV
jgi:hypothetical protein